MFNKIKFVDFWRLRPQDLAARRRIQFSSKLPCTQENGSKFKVIRAIGKTLFPNKTTPHDTAPDCAVLGSRHTIQTKQEQRISRTDQTSQPFPKLTLGLVPLVKKK